MSKVLIVGGCGSYIDMIKLLGQHEVITKNEEFLKKPEDFSLVLFTGGEDVCPALYGHSSPRNMCHYNLVRDITEESIFVRALEHNIPMTGICRGSQFLNVMCGGTMMHHITNHGSSHMMETLTGHKFIVTSTHHQMCLPSDEGFILGYSAERRSRDYFGDKDLPVDYDGLEVESIYYPDKKVFAVQYHPEYMAKDSAAVKWYLGGVRDLLTMSDAEFKAKYIGRRSLTVSV